MAAVNYTPRLTARRAGEVGALFEVGFHYQTFYGAQEFFSAKALPASFLKGCGVQRPASDPSKAALIAELRDLFHAYEDWAELSFGPAQLRGEVWWAAVRESRWAKDKDGANERATLDSGLEVKLDLLGAVDRAYVRSRGGQGTMGYRYGLRKHKQLPQMQWRLVRTGAGEAWLVLAQRGFAGRGGGWPMAGAVRCHPARPPQP